MAIQRQRIRCRLYQRSEFLLLASAHALNKIILKTLMQAIIF